MPCYGHYDKHNEVQYIVYYCKEQKLQEIKNTKVLYSKGGGRVIYANENAVLEPNEALMKHLHSAFDENNKVHDAYITPTEFWYFTPDEN